MRVSQGALQDKREELLKVETMLKDVEDKYYSSTGSLQNSTVTDLRVSTSITTVEALSRTVQ